MRQVRYIIAGTSPHPPHLTSLDQLPLLCLNHRQPTTASSTHPPSDNNTTTTHSTHLTHHQPANMTRTHKATDRDHVGLANGTAAPEEHLPRYFAKSGYSDVNPNTTKKQGGGKGNWGVSGVSELEDYSYNFLKPKRRSNSTSAAAGHSALKTKFEILDEDAMVEYDEDLHGPDGSELEKMSTSSSADTEEEQSPSK